MAALWKDRRHSSGVKPFDTNNIPVGSYEQASSVGGADSGAAPSCNDLQTVVAAWPNLPVTARLMILDIATTEAR